MKRWLMLVLFLLSIILISACSDRDSSAVQAQPETLPAPAPSSTVQLEAPLATDEIKRPEVSAIRLTFAGDTMMAGRVGDIVKEKGMDYPLSDAAPVFQKSDLSMVNLETAISERGSAKNKAYTFRSDPSMADALKRAGIDIVSIANNHALDYGVDAFVDTMEHLKKAGLEYVGGGVNQEEAYSPIQADIKGKSMHFFAFSRVLAEADWHAGKAHPGMSSAYDPNLVYQAVKPSIGKNDYTVVYLHWGKELAEAPLPYQVDLAHGLIDLGVDLVIGSHPHVLQGFEWYKGKFIAYSLGNFVFTTSRAEEGRHSGILEITLEDDRISPRFLPMYIDQGAVRLADEDQSKRIMDRLKRLSKGGTWTEDGHFQPNN